MKPLFFTLASHLHLKVIPDTQVHLDGHPVLSYNYNVYVDRAKGDPTAALSKNPIADKVKDPDYLGNIAFEKPDHLFTYTSGTEQELTNDEVQELIRNLSHIINNPALWSVSDEDYKDHYFNAVGKPSKLTRFFSCL